MGLKEFCTLLLAGGIGAGSVVGVQAVKAPTQREARAQKAKPKSRPAVARPKPKLPDCPVIVAPLGAGLLPDLAQGPLGRPMAQPLPRLGELPGLTGPAIVPTLPPVSVPTTVRPLPVPPVTGAIPEPGTWAMMVAGFGLIGLALRRRERASA